MRDEMRPLVYRITKHTIPGWVPFHEKEPLGIAYETESHFVHIFGRDRGLWTISPGLTVTQSKTGSLRDWIEQTFGAVDIKIGTSEVGHTVEGVWRPGLYSVDETLQGLAATVGNLRQSEQCLLLLIHRLDELLHFVEPTRASLQTYSHKARELLILACTEVENYWKSYLRIADVPSTSGGWGTKDYVRLAGPLHLSDYVVSLPRYMDIDPIRPFSGWSSEQPTRSLPWYHAYNKTKHDRTSYFSEASIWNCLQAVAAVIALFSTRFGPFRLFLGNGTLSALINQSFSVELEGCASESFYAPSISIPVGQVSQLICYGAQEQIQPRIVDKLSL